MGRLNINVSTVDYEKTGAALKSVLGGIEQMVHGEDGFVITDSEFAFGWHFFVVSIRTDLIKDFAELMGDDFERLRGRGMERKFITWLTEKMTPQAPRFKLEIKEEMESSKYGLF